MKGLTARVSTHHFTINLHFPECFVPDTVMPKQTSTHARQWQVPWQTAALSPTCLHSLELSRLNKSNRQLISLDYFYSWKVNFKAVKYLQTDSITYNIPCLSLLFQSGNKVQPPFPHKENPSFYMVYSVQNNFLQSFKSMKFQLFFIFQGFFFLFNRNQIFFLFHLKCEQIGGKVKVSISLNVLDQYLVDSVIVNSTSNHLR